MNFELRKYNIDKVKEALKNVKGKAVIINDTSLYGVVSIDIEEEVMYDCDPIPEENYDGGKTDYIKLVFNYENGSAAHSFCQDIKHCEIIFETDDLWIIQIKDLKEYIEREIFDLQFRLKDFEGHMSK